MGKPIKLRTVRRPVCVSCICRGQASQPSQWIQHEVGGEILRTIHMMPGPCYNEKKAQHMKSKPVSIRQACQQSMRQRSCKQALSCSGPPESFAHSCPPSIYPWRGGNGPQWISRASSFVFLVLSFFTGAWLHWIVESLFTSGVPGRYDVGNRFLHLSRCQPPTSDCIRL